MKKEFKFRVWDNKKKLFLDGIPPMEYMLDHDEWDHRDCYDGDPRIFINNVFSKDFNGRLIFQQYTGLKDKNGKEIYEGDLIEGMHDFGPAGFRLHLSSVRWDNKVGYQWEYWDLSTLEVIGNIFENESKKTTQTTY